MASKWTEELRAAVVNMYLEELSGFSDSEKPTHSLEACKTVADKYGFTANGVRLVLSQEGVYITKNPRTAKAATDGTPKKAGASRGSKAAALAALKTTISNIDPELLNEELIDKLTGVQAEYFNTILTKVV